MSALAKLKDLAARNPLVKAYAEQREYNAVMRQMKRRRAKAKANRDKLVTRLAHMTDAERESDLAKRLRLQVLNLNRVVNEER
jgi:hypothetical protein